MIGAKILIDIDNLRQHNKPEQIAITEHARQRMVERGIHLSNVIECIKSGEIIKQYENDKPFPSCLILGMPVDNKYLHVVVSQDDDFIYLITAYYPSPEQWEADFKTRKEQKS